MTASIEPRDRTVGSNPTGDFVPRAMCSACGRPSALCLCNYIAPIATRTRVVILQHPRERSVPIGTARLAELGLTNSERLVGVEFADSAELARALGDPEAPPILLFPGAEAKPLSELPAGAQKTLIVIDGTWSQAEKIVRKNPRLASLPRYSLKPSAPSRYRIRRAPAAECISTVEAVAEALEILEGPHAGVRGLLAPFDALVEQQLAFKRERAASRHTKRVRPARPRRRPELPSHRESELVVAYGEANGWPRHSPYGEAPELVHFAAERLSTGERFSAFIAPLAPLAPSFAHHTGLSPESVRGGEPSSEFARRWHDFLGPSALLGVWGHFVWQTLARGGGAVPELLDLRSVTRNFLRKSPGEVESAALILGLSDDVPWVEGRTGRRLAALSSIARALFADLRAE